MLSRLRQGTALLLEPTAAVVWEAATDWISVGDLERILASRYPGIDTSERAEALERIVTMFIDEDLVEQSAS